MDESDTLSRWVGNLGSFEEFKGLLEWINHKLWSIKHNINFLFTLTNNFSKTYAFPFPSFYFGTVFYTILHSNDEKIQ